MPITYQIATGSRHQNTLVVVSMSPYYTHIKQNLRVVHPGQLQFILVVLKARSHERLIVKLIGRHSATRSIGCIVSCGFQETFGLVALYRPMNWTTNHVNGSSHGLHVLRQSDIETTNIGNMI